LRRCEYRSPLPFACGSNMSVIDDCALWVVPP
jgi:hypothetical protein